MQRPAATVGIFIALFLAVPAIAGQYEDAKNALDRGDTKTALRLLLPLAEQGNPDAQFVLQRMYFNGEGVPQDWDEAIKWLKKAVAQGHAPSQFALGQCYERGYGVPQDLVEAIKWQTIAADQGYPFAQSAVGELYEKGEGVPKNYVLAYMWYSIAISRFPDSAIGRYSRRGAENRRDDLVSKMTADQIAEAQRLAREWKPK